MLELIFAIAACPSARSLPPNPTMHGVCRAHRESEFLQRCTKVTPCFSTLKDQTESNGRVKLCHGPCAGLRAPTAISQSHTTAVSAFRRRCRPMHLLTADRQRMQLSASWTGNCTGAQPALLQCARSMRAAPKALEPPEHVQQTPATHTETWPNETTLRPIAAFRERKHPFARAHARVVLGVRARRRQAPLACVRARASEIKKTDLAGRRLVIDHVDAALARNSDNTVLIAQIQSPRKAHRVVGLACSPQGSARLTSPATGTKMLAKRASRSTNLAGGACQARATHALRPAGRETKRAKQQRRARARRSPRNRSLLASTQVKEPSRRGTCQIKVCFCAEKMFFSGNRSRNRNQACCGGGREHRRCRPRHGRQFGHGAHPQFGRAGPGGILGEVCGVRRGRGRLWRLASKEPSGALRLGRGGKRAWRRPLRTGTAAGHSLPRGRRLTTRRTRRRRHCRPSRRRCCSCPPQCPWSGSASWTTW